ncbi:MAG: hypothetical protein ACE5KX_01590 [Acidimicrobiia bacterium]
MSNERLLTSDSEVTLGEIHPDRNLRPGEERLVKGPGGPEIPPTGISVKAAKGAYFARVRNGEIVEFHSYPDIAGLMGQLGLMPSPGT